MSSNATTNETSNVTSLPSTSKAQTAKEVIAANVKLLIDQLEAGHSERLTAYLTAIGRFHNYSFGNILGRGHVLSSWASERCTGKLRKRAWEADEGGF